MSQPPQSGTRPVNALTTVSAPSHQAWLEQTLQLALTHRQQAGGRWMAAAAITFCVLLAVFDSPQLLRWYPVLISGFMLVLFSLSLKYGPPMVERLARLREPQLPPEAIRYTRQVTVAWSVFFFCNGLCAALLTLWAPLNWWMLYTGLISYGLIGLMFAIEWLIRQRVRGRK